MKNYRYFITGILFLGYSFLLHAQEKNGEDMLLNGMHSISSHELFEYVKELSSDKYEGRLTGAKGYDMAAQWLADKFHSWGVQPKGENGTYFQEFDNPYTDVFPGCELYLHIPLKKDTLFKHYQYVTEFIPGSTSGSGNVTSEVVYAGYGITAPELGYDDYKGLNVKGKIILIEREVPVNPEKNPEDFIKWEPYSYHQYKLKNAIEHGAVGMLYNYGPISNPNNDYSENFILTHVGDSVVKDLFSGTGKDHATVKESIRKTLKPQSFMTGKTVTVKNITRHHPEGKGSNVIGWIEGTDPVKDEVIIIGAHLDHTGKCWKIMPGANDNASGVAIMMGLARVLKKNAIPLKRSIMFIAFGAEEQGIVGSKAYLDNPAFPLDKTRVLLNLDGVGAGDKITAIAGKNFPAFYEQVNEANQKFIHRELHPTNFPNISRPRVDAARFMKKGVPVLSFSTYEVPSVYHQPGDNLEIITPEIMEDLAQLLYLSVITIANE